MFHFTKKRVDFSQFFSYPFFFIIPLSENEKSISVRKEKKKELKLEGNDN
jgi:hypothetical protein